MEIKYKGKTIVINEDLLTKNNVWKNLHDIIDIRIKLIDIFHIAENLNIHGQLTRSNCKDIIDKITELEYSLQVAWGFEKNEKYHTYQWSGLSGCTCPVMDNRDRIGARYWISESCPYHGGVK